jgi:hypothetical protein
MGKLTCKIICEYYRGNNGKEKIRLRNIKQGENFFVFHQYSQTIVHVRVPIIYIPQLNLGWTRKKNHLPNSSVTLLLASVPTKGFIYNMIETYTFLVGKVKEGYIVSIRNNDLTCTCIYQ